MELYSTRMSDTRRGIERTGSRCGSRRGTHEQADVHQLRASSAKHCEKRTKFEIPSTHCGFRARRDPSGKVRLQAMAVEFPEVEGHPNRLPFEGVLTLVDVASDKAPSGSRGHRVVLTREAAEAALPSLLGMAVGYKAGWDGHDARQKCGIITAAELDGRRLMVSGFLFARDFPEFGRDVTKCLETNPLVDGVMGMSYELADAHVADMTASVWTLTRATFTGAAILLREKAAYRSTSFHVKQPGCIGGRGVASRTH